MEIPKGPSIAELIDKHHEDTQEGPRPHLGASLLGHPCDRFLWLSFRWAVIEKFPGRILRLFRRGQMEEATIVKDLEAIGLEIHSTGGEQSRVDFGSHVSGSVDGIIESGVPEAPKSRHILECKTHGSKSFNGLQSKGLKSAKPMHWCQMQLYMHGTKIDRGLYYAINKDTDEIYTERVHYDKQAAQMLVDRGHRIALAERMPEPLSADPSWYQCNWCPCWDLCFGTRTTKEVNCRTCAHVTPTPEGTWTCARGGNCEIPLEIQRTGCPCHVIHPDLVPWEWQGGTEDGMAAYYVINGSSYAVGEPDANVYSSKELLGIAEAGVSPMDPQVAEEEIPF